MGPLEQLFRRDVEIVIDSIVQAVKTEFILSEDELLVSAARQTSLNLRANPVVFLLHRIHKQLDTSIDASALSVVDGKTRIDVILDGAGYFRRGTGQELRHHPALAGDGKRYVGENGPNDTDAFLEVPVLLRLVPQPVDSIGREPNSLVGSVGVIGHDVVHNLLCNRVPMKDREVVA